VGGEQLERTREGAAIRFDEFAPAAAELGGAGAVE
jgi:hypothetical protein